MLLCSGIAPATAEHRRQQTLSQLSLATVAPVTESSVCPRPQCCPSQHLKPAHLCTLDSPMFPDPSAWCSGSLFASQSKGILRGEAPGFPTPSGSSCLPTRGNPREQDRARGVLPQPCPAHGAPSTHSLDAALRGDSSARTLPSFASWRTLVVHALAAAWAEPGGSSVTVLTRILGLRRAKTRVNLGRHRRTPVPSLSQKSHLPPAFPCPRSLQAYPVREGSSRDAPAPQYPDSRCTTTCWVQSTPVASISHTHLSPPALSGSPCAPSPA